MIFQISQPLLGSIASTPKSHTYASLGGDLLFETTTQKRAANCKTRVRRAATEAGTCVPWRALNPHLRLRSPESRTSRNLYALGFRCCASPTSAIALPHAPARREDRVGTLGGPSVRPKGV